MGIKTDPIVNMKQISLEEAKQVQLEIMDYFDSFCRKNDIKYSLADGTLIGAVRHKGFIPWDDDIDVMMLRSEFDKFVKLHGDGDRYRLTNKRYGHLYVLQYRLCDSHSILKFTVPFKCKIDHGIFIDIMPIDNYPDSEEERQKQQDAIAEYGMNSRIMCAKWKYLFTDPIGRKDLWKRIKMTFTTMEYWRNKAHKVMSMYNRAETKMLAEMEFWRHQPWVFPKETFSSYIDIDFEGRKYMSIKNYDTFLTAQYGDYMTLPPVEKQKPHHSFNAFWLGPETIHDLKNTFNYAMHGGGAIYGKIQTNSQDALEKWEKQGKTIFEFDLAISDDNQIVSIAHHLNKRDLEKVEIFEPSEKYTEKWFMDRKIYSITTPGMTPLSLKTIINALRRNNHLIVMLDLYGLFTKEQTEVFANALKDIIGEDSSLYGRILAEVYCRDMIVGIKECSSNINMIYGIDYGIAGSYKDVDNKITPKELTEKRIEFVSYPLMYQKSHPEEMEAFRREGFCIFCRTENNTKEKKLRELGVNVNLIDYYYTGLDYYLHKFYSYIGVDIIKRKTARYRIRKQIQKNRNNYAKNSNIRSV